MLCGLNKMYGVPEDVVNMWSVLNTAGPMILIFIVVILFLAYGAKTVLELIFEQV